MLIPRKIGVVAIAAILVAGAAPVAIGQPTSASQTQMAASAAAVQAGAEESLGAPIQSASINASIFTELDGRAIAVAISNGEPSVLSAVDALTGERVAEIELEGVAAVWGLAVAEDGAVYIGTQRDGHLRRWVPGSEEVTDLGVAVPGETHIWRLTIADDGTVFGGTYPGGKIFGFDPADGTFTDYGTVAPGEQYVRSIAWARGRVYAGTMTSAQLVELHPDTGQVRTIELPEEYRDQSSVYDLDAAGNYLFARVQPASDLLVMDLRTQEWVHVETDVSGLDVAPHGPGNATYFETSDGELMRFALTSATVTATGHERPDGVTRPRGYSWIDLPGYRGSALASVDYGGKIWIVDPERDQADLVAGDFAGTEIPIRSLATGPDGAVYVGGFLGATGMGRVTSEGSVERLPGIGQVEGAGAVGQYLLIGRYPGAQLYRYDTTRPWQEGTNPVQLEALGENQDRPVAVAAASPQVAAIASVPEAGQLGGALTLLDVTTGARTVHRDLVPDQSPISLLALDDVLIGGTTIWGGLGIEPTTTEGQLFVWDTSAAELVHLEVPVPGQESVSALVQDPISGDVWGLTEGWIFAFDPVTRQVTQRVELFDAPQGQPYWLHRELMVTEGALVGVTQGRLFRYDLDTGALEVLAEGSIQHLAMDSDGRLYFARGTELFTLDPTG